MENNNDQKWKLADVLANFTKSQLQKQQEIAIREEMKQRMMNAQAQNLAQFVPGVQPAPQEQDFPQDFATAKEGGIHIDPSKRGTFKAQATRMGMGVQEAARHILANKDKYSSKMVKKANFARNFAKEEGGEMFDTEDLKKKNGGNAGLVSSVKKETKPPTKLKAFGEELKKYEAAFENWLGNPMDKAQNQNHKFMFSKKPGETNFLINPLNHEDPSDNIRHASAGYYTSKAIADKFPKAMQYTGIPQITGAIGSTLLGLGHELSSNKYVSDDYDPAYTKKNVIREAIEDAGNNGAGAFMNMIPFLDEQENLNFIKYLSDNNILADGIDDPEGKINLYWKDQKGNVKKPFSKQDGGQTGGLDEYKSGGYTVRRSSDRKGKTHVVIGPDGTEKYFGDPGMGERSKSKYGKEAFYKRHAQNLKDNPYFRAYARATWEEGGEIENKDYENEENENEDYEMVSGIADILQQVKDIENRRQIAKNMIEDFEEEDVDYNLQKFMDMAKLKRGGEMIRRADGSYSQRGLWDNIRANKGSGKAPTKEMLAQERKIKRKKYNDGGTLPSCEEGYYWNPDKQSCEPIANYSDLNDNQKFLISMANSPLFEERYNKMIGRKIIPMEHARVNKYQIVPEVFGPEQMPAENFRKNIIENVSTVKYAPKGEGNFDPEYYKGAILPAAYYETHTEQLDSINNVLNNPKYNKRQFKDSLDELQELKKRLENKNHTIFTSEKEDRPYTNTHETSHASTLGELFSVYPYKAQYRNPFKESGEQYLKDATELKTDKNQEIYESLIKTYENIGNKMLNYKGYKDYYDNPLMQEYLSKLTEIKARKDAALKYMMDKGLYDPINNRFTEKDYNNLLRVKDQDEIQDLIHNYSKEDIIRMFNEIVANNPKSEPVAKRGGQLGPFLL